MDPAGRDHADQVSHTINTATVSCSHRRGGTVGAVLGREDGGKARGGGESGRTSSEPGRGGRGSAEAPW